MPATGAAKAGPEKGPGGAGRTTFRPPWVKESSTAKPPAPWASSRKNSTIPVGGDSTNVQPPSASSKENGQFPKPAVKEAKLQSREIKVPIMTEKPKKVPVPLKKVEAKETPKIKEKEKSFLDEMPKLRHVDKEKSINQSVDGEAAEPRIRPVLRKVSKVEENIKPPDTKDKPEFTKSILKPVVKEKSIDADTKIPAPPPFPKLTPPPPPPPPPPPGLAPPQDFKKGALSSQQKQTLEKLKTRPRRRPDWSEMMKEVESGRKLNHVQCNDRSKPIITTKSMTKVSGQFVYETEKANVHNKLLQQIQGGIRLKPTRCNDRSKPILEGLRKFRRQMTIEEQIQKSESKAVLNLPQIQNGNAFQVAQEPESEDEMDDIDKLRDDLQSTKQLLALELRNKEAQEREVKRLATRVQVLEGELEREKWSITGDPTPEKDTPDAALVKTLRKDADDARKTCADLEKKFQGTAEQLDVSKNENEDLKRQIAALEKKLSQSQGGGYTRRASEAPQKDSSPEPDLEMSESESDEDEEKKTERLARRLTREVKMLRNKLIKLKDKQVAAKKERANLKEAGKKTQTLLKEENKKFKKLQKEVDKMASMMKFDEEEEEEEKEEPEEAEEEEEEAETDEETETEEESEDSGTETESESEAEDSTDEAKKKNLEPRVKRHETRLASLKKGNYLLQANVDRLQDEINKIREKSVTLQADLDSVLSELG